jgi:uncharacterized YigZ family protein
MPASGYPVPASTCESETRFKNSRFIGTVGPTSSVEAAQKFIESIRSRYPDASHHVYAFSIGHGATVTEGMSDDGEPSGTAGRPVLAVVKGSGLGDVAVVITRFFGGTKLGTGGLVRAYTQTAQQVLGELETTRKIERISATLHVPYRLHAACRRALDEVGAVIRDEVFDAQVTIELLVAEEDRQALVEAVTEASAGAARLTLAGGRAIS